MAQIICPQCGKELVKHAGKDGKADWYGCSGYRDGCKMTVSTNYLGVVLSDQDIEDIFGVGGPGKTGIKELKKKDGSGTYKAHITYKDGRLQNEFPARTAPAAIKPEETGTVMDDVYCPCCARNLVKTSTKYSCPGCGLSVNRNLPGATMEDEDIRELAETGKTKVFNLHSDKKNKDYAAYFEFDENWKTKMQFPSSTES